MLALKSNISAGVSGKAPIADAIRYALHHWDGLTVSPTMVASNSVESTTGAVAVGREA